MKTNERMLTIWNYAILTAALQAKQRLIEKNLNAQQIEQHLRLVRIGQELLVRLLGEGMQLPQVDLSYPPAAAAAPGSHVEDGKPAGSYQLKQGSGR